MAPMALRTAEPFDPEPPNNPAVEAAFQAVPDTMIGEILGGELHVQPRPAFQHARVGINLSDEIFGPFDKGRGGPGGWLILPEPELHLGRRPDKVVPDLAGWRRTRTPTMLDGRKNPAHFTLPPDWVCEILSPRTESSDRKKKMHIYQREGVGHVWLVDPVAQTLEIHRAGEGKLLRLGLYTETAPISAEPFDAIELSLATLWDP